MLQPEALIHFASNYVNVIKQFKFTVSIASLTEIPLIKWLDVTFGRKHVSTINGNISKYSSSSAGGVILQLQNRPYKSKYVVSCRETRVPTSL